MNKTTPTHPADDFVALVDICGPDEMPALVQLIAVGLLPEPQLIDCYFGWDADEFLDAMQRLAHTPDHELRGYGLAWKPEAQGALK